MANIPKFDPARRNDRVGPVQLPAEGRKGRPPAWPIPGRMRAGEVEAWRALWHTPQAVAWERLGWTRVVARYCRGMVEAEKTMHTSLLAEIRQLEDKLGLTPKAMRLLLWTVVGDTVTEKRREREHHGPRRTNARKRIAAVENPAEEEAG